ncbi:hypothetical protein BO221_11470 [Archangium sp. Cb G35]|nr:hypothetical protein BO221_11470 [Archangium sp. Cb G35]
MCSGTCEYQREAAWKHFVQWREKVRQIAWQESWLEGFREGWRNALLIVLEARGLLMDEQSRQRIAACSDLAQIERWLLKAVSVQSVQELFEP